MKALRRNLVPQSLGVAITVASLVLSGCTSIGLPFGAAATASPAPLTPEPLTSVTEAGTTGGVAVSATAGEFIIDLTPLATATALPTIELPTESAFVQGLQVWDGLPTYPAESQPDLYFRVKFDPSLWALTSDQFGSPALVHREIPGCLMTPGGGRGLPLNASVDHAVRQIGAVTYQVSTASINGVRQFVNYTGGNGAIFTAFQVNFKDQADLCLSDAELVLGTLEAVPSFQATPVATP